MSAIFGRHRYDSDILLWFYEGVDGVIKVDVRKSDEEIVSMLKWLDENGKKSLKELSDISGWGMYYSWEMRKKYIVYN